MNWRPISPFGSQVDLDLTAVQTSGSVAALQDLFDRHHLLAFEGQHLLGE
jgi:hypothetical protein